MIEEKESMNVVVGEGQVLSSYEYDEPKTNGVAEPMNNGSEGASCVPDGPEISQPKGPLTHRKRFRRKNSLKILLVENDYSTRQVVSALLQNCGYEVAAVANGLQAWSILTDMNYNHVDLILTEVIMPVLSGIGLLHKIMSHKTFKNIPLIMMSPLDSTGLVFSCLSKGAVDFLVKPVRKNELKNLWQHVWRRCSSSSGSGSRSSTESKIFASSKGNYEFENNTGSSDGSGTQISRAKSLCEFDRPISLCHQLPDTAESSCAQLLESKDPQEQDKKLENFTSKDMVETQAVEAPKDLSYVAQIKGKTTSRIKELPPLQPTLNDDINVLRHSYSSALSKYNTTSSASKGPTGNVGSCSPPDNISVPIKTEKMHNTKSTLPNQRLIPPTGKDQVHAGAPSQQVQVYHHHHHHQVHNVNQLFQMDSDDCLLKNMVACTVESGSREVNAGYCSTNGNGTGGSKHGSNKMDGSGNNELVGLIGKVSGSEADEERLRKRRASLIKFLKKRKLRSFERKVRYQTRKRLAEQRLRIKGKFVRHIGTDTNVDNLGAGESVQ